MGIVPAGIPDKIRNIAEHYHASERTCESAGGVAGRAGWKTLVRASGWWRLGRSLDLPD